VLDASGWRKLVVAAATLGVVAGCERWNPAAISRQRHPELYAAVESAPRPRPVPEESSRPADRQAAAADLAEPKGETVIVAAAPELAPPGPGLDIAAARVAGTLRIDVNDPAFALRLDALFDGDTSTLARTEDVNPLVVRFRFETPVRLRGARIYPSYSTYDWSLRPAPDSPRLMVENAAEEQWSAILLPDPVETAEIRLDLRRLVRDNFVHVNEVILLVDE
jgi:hypothetical protein